MSKLKLDLDALDVNSFETVSSIGERGTVWAHDATRLADSCGCPALTDGCSLYCGGTNTTPTGQDTNTDTIPDGYSNNCYTLIVH